MAEWRGNESEGNEAGTSAARDGTETRDAGLLGLNLMRSVLKTVCGLGVCVCVGWCVDLSESARRAAQWL